MRVLVTGGTGSLGREVVPQCLQRGWTVRVMSRRLRPADVPGARWPGAEGAPADLHQAAAAGEGRPGVQGRPVRAGRRGTRVTDLAIMARQPVPPPGTELRG